MDIAPSTQVNPAQPEAQPASNGIVRVAAVADLHFGRHPPGSLQPLLTRISRESDVLLLCGDLTDHGLPEEGLGLVREIGPHAGVPIVAVLGNHDHESGRSDELMTIFRDAGITMLDGDAVEVRGIGFAGTKGFCGGFGRHALGAWGEPAMKDFVQEALSEALKLETALARVRAPQRVALLHYAPVQETVDGEPLEIYPFLGSSRLEEPLGRFDVSAVFHGHAHHGRPAGRTARGAPVFNVSYPLLQRVHPERPFHVIDLAAAPLALPSAEPPRGGGERR
jgi:Icc-related predicted phosphoesterase